jgi:hypothetical protein
MTDGELEEWALREIIEPLTTDRDLDDRSRDKGSEGANDLRPHAETRPN